MIKTISFSKNQVELVTVPLFLEYGIGIVTFHQGTDNNISIGASTVIASIVVTFTWHAFFCFF